MCKEFYFIDSSILRSQSKIQKREKCFLEFIVEIKLNNLLFSGLINLIFSNWIIEFVWNNSSKYMPNASLRPARVGRQTIIIIMKKDYIRGSET